MDETAPTVIELMQASAIREQVALTQTQIDVLANISTTHMSVVFGYIVAAFFVGQTLTRVQVTILNGIYIWFTVTNMFNARGAHDAGRYQYLELLALQPDRGMPAFWEPNTAILIIAINMTVLCASLWFMQDVRRKNKATS